MAMNQTWALSILCENIYICIVYRLKKDLGEKKRKFGGHGTVMFGTQCLLQITQGSFEYNKDSQTNREGWIWIINYLKESLKCKNACKYLYMFTSLINSKMRSNLIKN